MGYENFQDTVVVPVTGNDFEHLVGVTVALKCIGEQMAVVVIREEN